MKASTILSGLGIAHLAEAGDIAVHSPINGELIGCVASKTVADVDAALANAQQAFASWRNVPAPRRGELVRLLGNKLREQKHALGSIITLETGSADRQANMHAFAARALHLLLENVSR